VDGKIFSMGLPDEVVQNLIIRAGGSRFRIPTTESKHNPLYRKSRNKSICQRYMGGATPEKIASDYHISVRRVNQILSNNGIKRKEENQKSLEERIRLALRMNMTVTEIAKREGRSRQWIYQVIREKNLK
jgi:Mor family transcriptional regulator